MFQDKLTITFNYKKGYPYAGSYANKDIKQLVNKLNKTKQLSNKISATSNISYGREWSETNKYQI